ncbi:hypothetical protein E4T47_06569 [Aureobasidium subglaciale]|nr:hypothetical protein E4T47_06569 [Aureobasidium subglaciale]
MASRSIDEHGLDPGYQQSKKRKISRASTLSTRHSFSRKRALVACQPCRAKKAKCDNTRPSCSRCRNQDSECVYEDSEPNLSFDRGTLAIINRLDYLIDLTESNNPTRLPVHEGTNNESQHGGGNNTTMGARSDVQHRQVELSTIDTDLENLTSTYVDPGYSSLVTELSFASCEDILNWPVFGDGQHIANIEALFTDPVLSNDGVNHLLTERGQSRSNQTASKDVAHKDRGFQEDDVLVLVESFLGRVHTKNPILDPTELRRMACGVAQRELQWDGPTCLVLLTCALTVISSPFARVSTIADNEQYGNSCEDTPKYSLAEYYYDEARKRIGLLGNGPLATECYFLIGVYEMYSLRPFQASVSFNRACVTFQISNRRSFKLSEESALLGSHACRQYWSCLKSEQSVNHLAIMLPMLTLTSEISVELQVPSSGLTSLNYTQSFPLPPESRDNDSCMSASPTVIFYTSPEPFMERLPQVQGSWYYYLADIAARRILQRVVDSFYAGPIDLQLTTIASVIKAAEELSRQIEQWYQNLPAPIAFDYDMPAEDELAYHLQARTYELQERTYRPFLFFALHYDLDEATGNKVRSLAQKHSAVCVKLIRQWDIRHRHHGTWLMVRQSFNSALLLIAAHKAGLSGLPQEQFEETVRLSVSTIRYWEREAADLKASRLILQDVMSRE